MKRIFLLLVLVGTSSVAAFGQRASETPTLTLEDLRGRRLRLSDYRGKVVLLNFWATWCPPCRAEMPELVAWQKQYGARGLQIIGITQPPLRRAGVRKLARRLKVNYPLVFGSKRTARAFGVREVLPVTIVIDRRGKVREQILGILEPEEFAEKIEPLLLR